MAKDVIIACDFDSAEKTFEFLDKFKGKKPFVKIGMELYYAEGPRIVKEIKARGHKIFLDLKLHDIPNTVAKASVNLLKNGINFFDIHTSGGSKMLSTTVKLARETAKKNGYEMPTILGVTLLSSFGQRTLTEELNVKMNIDEYVGYLTKIAKDSGIDGVMASASEAKKIREEFGEDFIILCPAIRPTWSVVNDQVRVVTPTDAVKAGVDFMVVGRPVLSAEDPVAAIKLIIDEIEGI